MTDLAIRVENLGKLYRIGGPQAPYKTLRESIMGAVTDPLRRLRNPQSAIKNRETIWALKDVSFEVKQGEVIGIIGRNGAGKSTLLKILSRITEPTEGQVELRGRVGSLLEVGTGFHPELTGRENIYLNGAILGMKRAEIERKFDEIVAFAEIEKFLDTPVKHYSSGMYVRLAFAVAAHLEPEILLVDEVLAVGDAQFQKKCLGKMGDVAAEGRTVLFVSHNMAAIRQLCKRAFLLLSGRVVADGSSSETVDMYLQDMKMQETKGDVQLLISRLPSDPVFRFIDISILQDDHPQNEVASGKPTVLRVEYQVLQETPGLHVYFLLYDSEGTLLFESIHNGDVDGIPTVMPGYYVSRATIPADFLAPTQYELHIMAAIHNARRCIPEPIKLLLDVHVAGRVNRAYPGYRTPGKLAPLIEWVTERRSP